MDYYQSGIATTYDEARALTPALATLVIGPCRPDRYLAGRGPWLWHRALFGDAGIRTWCAGHRARSIGEDDRPGPAETGNEPCRIWAGVSTRASAPGWLRRSRVYVADLSPPARSGCGSARMPACPARRWLRLHPHRNARKRCRRAKLFPGGAGHARRRLPIQRRDQLELCSRRLHAEAP